MAQTVVRPSVFGVEVNGLEVGGDRPVQLPVGYQGIAQVVVRRNVSGSKGAGPAEVRDGRIQLPRLVQSKGAIEVHPRVMRAQRQRRRVVANRLGRRTLSQFQGKGMIRPE